MHWVWTLAAIAILQTPGRPGVGQLPPLPLTQLDDRQQPPDLDARTFTCSFAQPSPIRDVLVQLVRGTNLSLVVDPAVSGTFVGELKNVTVRRALEAVLPPFGLDYAINGTVVRIFRRQPETRFFDLNYNAARRTGSAHVGAERRASVSTTTSPDVFADIGATVKTLISDQASYSIDRAAGLLQVTDAPERLDRVGAYLEAVHSRVQRQVQIDARVIQLERFVESMSPPPLTTGARVPDIGRFLAALAAQGRVTTLASPQLLTLNNETTIVRAAESGGGGRKTGTSVTISVTPQIGDDGAITLSLSPLIRIAGAVNDDEERAVLREADTLARVADGETLIIAGFGPSRTVTAGSRRDRGWFGRPKPAETTQTELLVLLTPHIVASP